VKRRLLLFVLMGIFYALAGYAADNMITNDDLERKYPSTESPTNKQTGQQQNEHEVERSEHDVECEELKQLVDEARQALHDENDPLPYDKRAIKYYKINTTYLKKCGNR